jgi:hypothetical protein
MSAAPRFPLPDPGPAPPHAPSRAPGWARCAALVVMIALAMVPGCNTIKRPPPDAPAAPGISPQITKLQPPALSTGVVYDTDIFVEFAQQLDTATVNVRTVFLKIETVRQPITVWYDPATRRIRVVPDQPLTLYETYTVELSATISTVDGHPLGQSVSWQFTVSSLLRPQPAYPPAGPGYQSPFVALTWSGPPFTDLDVSFEVYAGADSAAIAARSVAPIGVTQKKYYLPRTRWSLGTRYFWAITAANASTLDRLDGAVASFTTPPANTPIDSMVVAASEWSRLYWDANPQYRERVCQPESLTTGPNYSCSLRWPLSTVASTLRLAGATLWMTMMPIRSSRPNIWAVRARWGNCVLGYPGPPFVDDDAMLADGVQVPSTSLLRYESDVFTAHLEALSRLPGFFGYAMRSQGNQVYGSPNAFNVANRPVLKLYYYRTSPAPSGSAPATP